MEFIFYLIIFIIAISIGSICSMIGIGGNSLFIPILVVFFGINLHVAIATLLFSSIFIALSSTIVYAKEKKIDYKLAIVLEVTTASAAFLATQVTVNLPTQILEIVFVSMMIFIALYMILSNYFSPLKNRDNTCPTPSASEKKWYTWKRTYTVNGKHFPISINLILALSISFAAGFLVGMIGIAGGTIKVPLIHIICGAPMIFAVGTSFFMIIITGIFASVGYFMAGLINFILAIPIILGLILGAQIGARTAVRVEQKKLKILFGVVVMFFSLLILL
ncbi:MAG: sulfite exporter TauE/SafE family protein [Candidatus Odinarchaeia archaeon]